MNPSYVSRMNTPFFDTSPNLGQIHDQSTIWLKNDLFVRETRGYNRISSPNS